MTPSSVLIVDDEPVNHRLIRAVLAPLGYHMQDVYNGDEALAAVDKKVPDIILLDVVMPLRDGYSVCRVLKQNQLTKLVPIILLTSLDQLEDKIKGVDAGADDYLIKPFRAAELMARVRALLALKSYTDELENASAVLQGIAAIVDQRDAYTGHHCKRVGDYGAAVALEMGLPSEDIKLIRLAGLFHDLGKIGTPDFILLKPGPLDPAERRTMETHAMTGADLLKPMNTMAQVIPFIRHHHERLDGSGYPDGISGSAMSMALRILSVVDIYDALATKRPYKNAFPKEKCLAILREEAGRGWRDPDVVESLTKFLRLV